MKIGIAGFTTSGKTTISEYLSKKYGANLISLDQFYFTSGWPQVECCNKKVNFWDSPDCFDWENVVKSVKENSDEMVFIESFLLFYNKEVAESIGALIYLEYSEDDFDIALKRRLMRWFGTDKIPDDYMVKPDKSDIHFECNYFKNIAWPFAQKNIEYCRPSYYSEPVLVLKATSPLEENINKSILFINELLNKK